MDLDSRIMLRLHHRWQLLALWLAVAGVLFRGLIPAGLMPATAEAARHGSWLVLCTHGQTVQQAHAGHGGASPGQCPFAAAASPAVPGSWLAPAFSFGGAEYHPGWGSIVNLGTSPRLQPPARAPPLFS